MTAPAGGKCGFSLEKVLPSGDATDGLSCAGAVVSFQPSAQAVQTRIEHSLRGIRLVEFIAHFPFNFLRDDDLETEILPALQPVVEEGFWTRHQREEGELVDDPWVK